MLYKKKIFILGISAALLSLVYILTLLINPVRKNAKNELFTWLPPGSRDKADRIEIYRGNEKIELVIKSGAWFALLGSVEVPAKQGRIDDLFRILGTRGAFPLRGSNVKSHAELDLDGSSRLVIRGGSGIPLLDLIVGKDDPSGREVFLRKNGENEFRSGDRLIGTYISGEKTAWFDMKLFEEKSVAQVQRIQVRFYDFYGIGEEVSEAPYGNYSIIRNGESWFMDSLELDKGKTENWIYALLEAQGEDVLPANKELSGSFSGIAEIRIELGDGSALLLEVDQPGEDGKSSAMASGKSYIAVLSQWTITRLLRNKDFFRK